MIKNLESTKNFNIWQLTIKISWQPMIMVILIFQNYRHCLFNSFFSKWWAVFRGFLSNIFFINVGKILIFSFQFVNLNLNYVKSSSENSREM